MVCLPKVLSTAYELAAYELACHLLPTAYSCDGVLPKVHSLSQVPSLSPLLGASLSPVPGWARTGSGNGLNSVAFVQLPVITSTQTALSPNAKAATSFTWLT